MVELLRIAVLLIAVLLVSLRMWQPTMRLSMSVAIVAVLAMGEAVTALTSLLFVQVAVISEGLTA